MTTARPACIVLIDGEEDVLGHHRDTLIDAGFAVTPTLNGFEGLVAVEELRPEVVLILWSLSFVHGEIIISTIRTGLADPPPVLVLADEDADPAPILRVGAHVVLPSSVDADTLLSAIRDVLSTV